MKLFEITNGGMGYAYMRVYAYAQNENDALQIAEDTYRKSNNEHRNLACQLLTDTATQLTPFCTHPSDTGWDVGDFIIDWSVYDTRKRKKKEISR